MKRFCLHFIFGFLFCVMSATGVYAATYCGYSTHSAANAACANGNNSCMQRSDTEPNCSDYCYSTTSVTIGGKTVIPYSVYCGTCNTPYTSVGGYCKLVGDFDRFCQLANGTGEPTVISDYYLRKRYNIKPAYQQYASLVIDDGGEYNGKTIDYMCQVYKLQCADDAYGSCSSSSYKFGESAPTSGCYACPKCATCNGSTTWTCPGTASGCSANTFKTNSGCGTCPSNATCSGTSFTCDEGYFADGNGCTSCADSCGTGFSTFTSGASSRTGATERKHCRAESSISITPSGGHGTYQYTTACCCTDTCTNLCSSGYTCVTNDNCPSGKICSSGCCVTSVCAVPGTSKMDCLGKNCNGYDSSTGCCTNCGGFVAACTEGARCSTDADCGGPLLGRCVVGECDCEATVVN